MAITNGPRASVEAVELSDRPAAIPLSDLAAGLDSNPLDIASFLSTLLPTAPSSSSSASVDLGELDTSLNELLTRFTLLSQDTSSALEQSISDISRTVPRLNYDLQFMRESATTLQTSLNSVQGKVKHVNQSHRTNKDTQDDQAAGNGESSSAAATTKSLDKLVHLDKLKTRMESARDILREAESWSTLESEIMASIAASEWEKAGSRLAEAERSMVVFQATPGEYETRKALLVSLQNGLETALSSALEEALKKRDTEACTRFYGVFESMGRESEYRNYYFTQRRRRVLDEWAEFNGEGFAGFLPRFYAVWGQTIEKEVEQVGAIYPAGRGKEILATFIQNTLDALSPSLQSRLASMADAMGPTALPDLIKTYKSTEEIALAFHAILDRAVSEAPSPVPPTTPRTPRKRDLSYPFSTTHRLSSFHASPTAERPNVLLNAHEWETSLFESFLDLQTSYGTLERRYLLHLLQQQQQQQPSSSALSSKKDAAATALSDRSVKIFDTASEAINRCTALTHGFGAVGLISALGEFLASFLEGSHSVLDSPPSTVQDELDLGLDYSTEDWAAIQSGLRVLKVCRDISTRLDVFQTKLSASLDHFVESPSPPNPAIPSSLSSATANMMTLLRQSTLNSSDLQLLLSPSSRPTPLLPRATEALSDLTRAAQTSLSTIILSPLRTALSTYPSLPVWSQSPRNNRRDGLSIPTFSLSPTDTIARVAEGLLNLLRVFEVYAQDPALEFSLVTLQYISVQTSASASASPSTPSAAPPAPVSPATALPPLPLPSGSTTYPPEIVLSTWISSLALTVLSDLTSSTLPAIQRLTQHGANQLSADLGYLGNAVRALDVEWADLEVWREGAEVDEAGWKVRLGKEDLGEGEEEKRVKDIWTRIGRLRGWGI